MKKTIFLTIATALVFSACIFRPPHHGGGNNISSGGGGKSTPSKQPMKTNNQKR